MVEGIRDEALRARVVAGPQVHQGVQLARGAAARVPLSDECEGRRCGCVAKGKGGLTRQRSGGQAGAMAAVRGAQALLQWKPCACLPPLGRSQTTHDQQAREFEPTRGWFGRSRLPPPDSASNFYGP